MRIECGFFNPVYWNPEHKALLPLLPITTELPAGENWAFTTMDCDVFYGEATSTLPLYLEEMISQDEQKDFYLEKKISYGDFLLTSFFILLILGLAVFGIRDFVKNRKLERL